MRIEEATKKFELYLQACGFSRSSREQYSRTLRQLAHNLEHSNSSMEVDQVRKDDLIDYLAYLEESGQQKNTLTVKALTLKKFFGWLKGARTGTLRQGPIGSMVSMQSVRDRTA